jgi:hypothetical protein
MAYADGELDADGIDRVEAILRTSDEAREVVAAMGDLGELVRDSALVRADVVQADGIADEVMKRVEVSRSIPVRYARSRNVRRIGVAVGGALALAAGAFLVVHAVSEPERPLARDTASETKPEGLTVPAPPETAPLPAASAQVLAQATPSGTPTPSAPGVDVEQVESPSHQVSVFYLPAVSAAASNANASSVVVWIGDDQGGH